MTAAPPDAVEDNSKHIDRARDLYSLTTEDIQIDDFAAVSHGDDGAWVAAWVWLPTCRSCGGPLNDQQTCEAHHEH